MTIIAAYDIATRSGWCVGEIGSTPEFGTADFSGKQGIGEALSRCRFFLTDQITRYRPSLLCFEAPYVPVPRGPVIVRAGTAAPRGKGPPPMNPLVLRKLLGLVGLVEEIAFERGIKCRECTTQEFTKFWTGKGAWGGRDAKKDAVMRVCRARGFDVADDNQADALALWHYAEATVAPEIAARRAASAGEQLPLHGTIAAPMQDRIGREALS